MIARAVLTAAGFGVFLAALGYVGSEDYRDQLEICAQYFEKEC